MLAFKELGILIEFSGTGLEEVGKVVECLDENYQIEKGSIIIRIDKKYFRPTEVELLIGDPAKAKRMLKWEPKYDLQMLVSEMVQSDLNEFKK